MFVDRVRELEFLNRLLERRGAGASRMLLMYGRRRVGKSTLLAHWIEASGWLHTFWTAEKESAALQRRKLYARLLGVPARQAPVFESWSELWEAGAKHLKDPRRILVLDELPYAAEADPAMLSSLQNAWDGELRHLDLVIALCGSQVRVMESILSRQSPLFGRLSGQWRLDPLPFSSLRAFFPGWTVEDRVGAWAIVGGVPAYLEWLDPELTLSENIREVVLAPGSMFTAEPTFLLYDELREPRTYLSILKSVGGGAHDLSAISQASLIDKAHLSTYLKRLEELRLMERRLPATLTAAEQLRSRRGRYHLTDPYFRFYFRFIAPYQGGAPTSERSMQRGVRQELDSFVGATAFEELARRWVWSKAEAGELGFIPEQVGSHWGSKLQVDVVAINHAEREVVVGECKWTSEKVDAPIARKLVERTGPCLLRELPAQGHGWSLRYALFSRAGFTDEAVTLIQRRGGWLIDAAALDRAEM